MVRLMVKDIIDTVYENIPINTHCPHCDRDIGIEELMDTELDSPDWDRLAIRIIHIVLNSLQNLDDRYLRKL